jgi:uncharacterized alkaline shock family protein YloU
MTVQHPEVATAPPTATPTFPGQRGQSVEEQTSTETTVRTERGNTSIATLVVRKIAGVAAREILGVHDLGTGGVRRVATVRRRIPGSTGASHAQGVAVEVGEREAAVDLDVVLEYGVSVPEIAAAIRANVIRSIEGATGLKVVEVNVSIDDLYTPDPASDQSRPSRVQ